MQKRIKNIERLSKNIEISTNKLNSDSFKNKAPKNIVEKEQQKLNNFTEELNQVLNETEKMFMLKHLISEQDKTKWLQYLIEEVRFKEIGFDVEELLKQEDYIYSKYIKEIDLIKIITN